jgi:N-acetylmuramoyl-L-alanine amidase
MSAFLTRVSSFSLLLCLGISVAFAEVPKIQKMLILQDGSVTKAYISLSEVTQFKAFMLQSPTRAVLDIAGAEMGSEFKLPNANGIVLAVRQGKTPTGIRIVLDLAQEASLKSELDSSSGSLRLAIDLTQKGELVAIPSNQDSQSLKTAIAANAKPNSSAPETTPPVLSAALPVLEPPPISKPVIAKPMIAKPVQNSVPGKSNIGYALMDDEIVQIDIDSSGVKPKTTVAKPLSITPPSLPNVKQSTNPSPAQPLPKKAKTVNDVLGSSARKLIIAIDAGHGGKDPGALGGNGLREKEVTLRVAKELTAIINADPGMKAILIRDDDTFVPLAERYQRARRAQADLFVSIHADAAENNAANGSSVYVLSTKGASSQAARWLADKENAADLVGGVSLDDKDKNLSAVLLDLSQSATMRMSEDAAGKVLQSLKDLGKAHKRDVEHANFVVLRSPDVPSMLIETGFITNAAEERKLADPEHRKRMAYAIAQGLREFFIEQPLPGTYYAKKPSSQASGINAGSGIIP